MKRIAFTIVLNGMPFIKQQYKIIPDIFDEWYIIEGATNPVSDTSWCNNISHEFYNSDKLSVDGTTEFLDSIASDKIHIIRKGDFWNGKVEMCNSFVAGISDCILMQFDVDEIWSPEVLEDLLSYAQDNDHFDGMLFRCNYYVGEKLKLKQSGGYADNIYEWSRLWKIRDNIIWLSHEPPRVKGCKNFLSKNYTQSRGWVFDHYAYVLEEQVRFKENFYGYTNAVQQWKDLQACELFPCSARTYLKWIGDDTVVIKE